MTPSFLQTFISPHKFKFLCPRNILSGTLLHITYYMLYICLVDAKMKCLCSQKLTPWSTKYDTNIWMQDTSFHGNLQLPLQCLLIYSKCTKICNKLVYTINKEELSKLQWTCFWVITSMLSIPFGWLVYAFLWLDFGAQVFYLSPLCCKHHYWNWWEM